MTIKTSKGNITASKDLLNYISILASEAMYNHINNGHQGLADEADKFGMEIYTALKEIGFYN